VFNPGERVEGFTSPLSVLLDAVGLLLRIEPWIVSQTMSILGAVVASIAVAFAWMRMHPTFRWPIPGLLVALSPAIAYHAAAGLGTTLAAGLLGLWVLGYVADLDEPRSSWAAGLALGLACFVRAELVLFAIPYVVAEWRRTRAPQSALSLVPLAGWTAFRLIYYHALLPVTYHVKKLPFLVDLQYGLQYLSHATMLTGIGVALALPVILLVQRDTGSPVARCIALGTLAYTLFVVYVGGDYMSFARFFVPVIPVAALIGSEAVTRLLAAGTVRIGLTLTSLVFLIWPRQETEDVFKYQEQLEQRWIRIGKALNRAVTTPQSIALGAVGAIGYFSGLKVIDQLGMTNDAVWRTKPDLSVGMKGHQRYDGEWARAQRPDIVLIGNGLFVDQSESTPTFPPDRAMLATSGFRDSYQPMAIDIPESYPLIFFLRRGSMEPIGAWAVTER
jgi:hypothetical protein